MTNTSEIFLADGEIFVGEIFVHHLLSTHLTLNTNNREFSLLPPPTTSLTFIHLVWMLVSPKVTWPSVITSLQTAHLVVE